MQKLWMTIAEIAVQPDDMPSGDTLGFMKVMMWASSHEDFVRKLNEYLSRHQWSLLSLENTEVVDPSEDYGDDENRLIDEMLQDRNAVRLGTYHSYKAD